MTWNFYRLAVSVGVMLTAVHALMAEDTSIPKTDDPRGAPAVINADSISFDRPNNLAIGTGHVVVEYKGARLTADKATFNTVSHEVWAEGDVRLYRESEEWKAPALYYNFDTRDVRIADARGFADGFLLHTEDFKQATTNYYTFARSTLTTCEYEQPHYRLQATRGEFWPGDRIVLYNVTARIGDVPVFWSPMLIWSMSGDEPPLQVVLGNGSELGFFALVSSYWRINKDLKLTVHLDGYTERGIGTGADIDYKTGDNGSGVLKGYYIHDSHPNDDEDDRDGKDNPEDRYRIQLQHMQQFDDKLTLRMDINKLSDPDVVDDFFEDEFRENREPQSVIDITRTGTIYTLSLGARPQVNDFHAEVERLPEVKLAINRTRLGNTSVFYEGETSAGYYRNEPAASYLVSDISNPPFAGESTRFDTYHQLLMPHTLWNWLSVVPKAGARYTYYGRGPETLSSADTDELRREVFNAGIETSFKLSRTWADARNKMFGVDGLRHVIQPFANYQWVSTPGLSPDEIYQFDTARSVTLSNGESLLITRWSPLDFSAYNTIDSIDKMNVLRFGMRQALQTRRGKRNWDLLEVEGWTDWRIEREDDETTFSDIFGTVRFRPAEWLSLNGFTRYDPHDGQWEELNTSANIGVTDYWSVGVGTRYLRDDSNLLAFRVAGRLSRRLTAQTTQRVDMEDGQWEEQEYSLTQETHDWYINYGVRYRSQRTSDDEIVGFVSVTLKAVPGVKIGFN
jgi:lipopolysaccharide assembly outer membrane protein LptD (OstA)